MAIGHSKYLIEITLCPLCKNKNILTRDIMFCNKFSFYFLSVSYASFNNYTTLNVGVT